jgi:hypothetical protein
MKTIVWYLGLRRITQNCAIIDEKFPNLFRRVSVLIERTRESSALCPTGGWVVARRAPALFSRHCMTPPHLTPAQRGPT